jgi:hypothetical protein
MMSRICVPKWLTRKHRKILSLMKLILEVNLNRTLIKDYELSVEKLKQDMLLCL